MRSAKSNNGRTEWAIIDGRLKEIGPESPTFTLTAVDTMTLTVLLMSEFEGIKQAAEHELAGYSQTYDAAYARKWFAGEKQSKQLQEGATGVEVDDLEIDVSLDDLRIELPDVT
jgi:hypothetical protein